MFEVKSPAEAFASLLQKAPPNCLPELLGAVAQLYNYREQPERSLPALLAYHQRHLSLVKKQNSNLILSEWNMLERLGGFKCAFLDVESDPAARSKRYFRHIVDVSAPTIISSEEVQPESLRAFFDPQSLVDCISFTQHLEQRYVSTPLNKDCFVKQGKDLMGFCYTVKLPQKALHHSATMNVSGGLEMRTRELCALFAFEHFFTSDELGAAPNPGLVGGSKFALRKEFKRVLGELSEKAFLEELTAMEDAFGETLSRAVGEGESLLSAVRLLSPVTRESCSWSFGATAKSQLFKDIRKLSEKSA